jgi:hypothetical protein
MLTLHMAMATLEVLVLLVVVQAVAATVVAVVVMAVVVMAAVVVVVVAVVVMVMVMAAVRVVVLSQTPTTLTMTWTQHPTSSLCKRRRQSHVPWLWATQIPPSDCLPWARCDELHPQPNVPRLLFCVHVRTSTSACSYDNGYVQLRSGPAAYVIKTTFNFTPTCTLSPCHVLLGSHHS